jgi:hypothetical protein
MDLKEIESENVDCIYLSQEGDRWLALVNAVMNLCVLRGLKNFWTSLAYYLLTFLERF